MFLINIILTVNYLPYDLIIFLTYFNQSLFFDFFIFLIFRSLCLQYFPLEVHLVKWFNSFSFDRGIWANLVSYLVVSFTKLSQWLCKSSSQSNLFSRVQQWILLNGQQELAHFIDAELLHLKLILSKLHRFIFFLLLCLLFHSFLFLSTLSSFSC